MKQRVLFYNSGVGKTYFELQSGMRPWGILMLITDGKYTLEFPSVMQLRTFSANTISYIPPNTQFIRKIAEPICFHQFHIHCDPNDALSQELSFGMLPIPEEQVSAIGRSLCRINAAALDSMFLNHILEHIIVEAHLFSSQLPKPEYSEDIIRVLRYMESHLAEDFKLAALAEMVNLSPTGLIWKFHQQLNTTPQKYFIQLRIQLAKQLLVETSLSVTQIAEKCGYQDVYYFSNAFRKNTGISPSTFRKSPRI